METGRADDVAGFRRVEQYVLAGHGRADFEALAERILTLEMHRAAGVRVRSREHDGAEGAVPQGRVVAGQELVLRYRWFPVAAPVRVLEAWEPTPETVRAGFSYEALPGHPESGRESFTAVLEPDGRVLCEIRAFSRPARWFSRLGGPVARAVQRRITMNYLEAARN